MLQIAKDGLNKVGVRWPEFSVFTAKAWLTSGKLLLLLPEQKSGKPQNENPFRQPYHLTPLRFEFCLLMSSRKQRNEINWELQTTVPTAFGKAVRRPITHTKLIDLADFSRPGLEKQTAECSFPSRGNCWHPPLCLSPSQWFWYRGRISSFKYTSETDRKVEWLKSVRDCLSRSWAETPAQSLRDVQEPRCSWFHWELGIQTPLRTQVVRICLFTLLHNWHQRWEQLASLACHIVLLKERGGTDEKWGFSSGLKYIADTVADGTG